MGKPRRKSEGPKKAGNNTREIKPEVFNDQTAANALSFKRPEYRGVGKDNKARNRLVDKGKVPRNKKAREYTAEELGIPKLNTALQPQSVVKKSGKKGKKFITDSKLQIILAEVQQKSNDDTASKLERARQIEAVREQKRLEMEEREQATQEKLERKKKDVRKKGKGASQKAAEKISDDTGERPTKSKRRVAFAV